MIKDRQNEITNWLREIHGIEMRFSTASLAAKHMNSIDLYKEEYKAVINGPVPKNEVDSLLNEFGVTEEFYRDWLIETGGGPIGPDWYDGITELRDSQIKLETEPWSISGFVIGWDGAGNPMVLQSTGVIITEDHNFGGVYEVASSFETLLNNGISS